MEVGVGTVAAGVSKPTRHVTISGYDADRRKPMTSIKHAEFAVGNRAG